MNKKHILIIAGSVLLVVLFVLAWRINRFHTLPEIDNSLSVSIQRRTTGEDGNPTVENYDFNIPAGEAVLEYFSEWFDKLNFRTCLGRSTVDAGLTQFSVMYMSGAELEHSVILRFDDASDYLHLSVISAENGKVKKSSSVLKSNEMDKWREEFYDLLRQSTDYLKQ